MQTSVVLFTRDLRVHDHPALAEACATSERVVPVFVVDDVILDGYARPNRAAFLADCLAALDKALTERGAGLVVRRGDVVDETMRLAADVGADAVYASADVSGYAQARERRLAEACTAGGIAWHRWAGVTVVPPGQLTPAGGDHFKVFTPYWRAWRDAPLRPVAQPPERVRLPPGLTGGRLPEADDLSSGERSPDLPRGGEREGRRRLEDWLDAGVAGYEDGNDRLAADATSRLSPYLHFGCLSPREIVDRADQGRRGVAAFLRQLCWRDFHHQTLAARPASAQDDYRPRGDRWADDTDALTAWKEGRTGFPVVDAGMRQLRREGWMHNRARLITASFLVKDCYVDWRLGAAHFLEWLVDGDVANNQMNWQWVAGTGADTRPHRVFNPITQAKRFDPDGAYVRRYVPELAGVDAGAIHEPWRLGPRERDSLDYPPPLLDHAEAVARFRRARGRT